MTADNEPPRERDYALQSELDSLREQEREGHATPKEQRRAEQLEHRLQTDEKGAERREYAEEDRETEHKTAETRARHRR